MKATPCNSLGTVTLRADAGLAGVLGFGEHGGLDGLSPSSSALETSNVPF